MRFDLHIHSNVSLDCGEPMENTVRHAVEIGLDGICFTDHCDLFEYDGEGVPEAGRPKLDCFENWQKSYGEIERVRAKWGDKVEILHGIELAEIVQDEARARQVVEMPGLDFLIGAVHAVTGRTEFFMLQYPDVATCRTLIREYLNENIQMARINLADVDAHIGYPNRYMARRGFFVDLMEYEKQLRELFSIVVQHGRGIELNTAGLRGAYERFTPDVPILKLYKSCGGEIITIGSDAHRATDVGSHIEEAQELLRTVGFRYMTVFRQRKPEFIPI